MEDPLGILFYDVDTETANKIVTSRRDSQSSHPVTCVTYHLPSPIAFCTWTRIMIHALDTSHEDSDSTVDPADFLLRRGERMRMLREMEQQDLVERQQQESDEPDNDLTSLVITYDSYLQHQRYYDDLKHINHRYIRYSFFHETSYELVIEQDKTLGKGGLCWDAAFILGEHLLATCPDKLVGKQIVELGCGTGLAGMMVGKAVHQASVALTDLPNLMDLLQRNVQRNFNNASCDRNPRNGLADEVEISCDKTSQGLVSAQVLDWSDISNIETPYEIIIGADIVASLYDPVALADTIHRLAHEQTQVYISFRERLSSIQRIFEQEITKRFTILDIQMPISRNHNPDVRILFASGRKTNPDK